MAEKFWLAPSYAKASGTPFPLKFQTLCADTVEVSIVVTAFGVLFGAMYLGFLYFVFGWQVPALMGTETTGSIVSCEYQPPPPRGSPSFDFRIRFSLEDGGLIEGRTSIIGSFVGWWIRCDDFPAGKQIRIAYARNHPEAPEIVDPALGNPWLRNWEFCCMPVPLLGVSLWLLFTGSRGIVRWIQAARKYSDLCNAGTLIDGEIVRCEGMSEGRNNDRFYVTAFYKAQTPDGEWITGRQRARRDHLFRQPLPEPGTPITVLYHSKHIHCML